jgi:membrane protease YdiL (CAAX protease family)
MEYAPLPANAPHKPLIEKFLALFEVFLLSGLVSGSLAILPFSLFCGKNAGLITKDVRVLSAFLLLETAITFILLLAILKSRGETICDLGLHVDRWKSHLLIGSAIVPFLFLITFAADFVFLTYFPEHHLERNPLTEIITTPQQLALLIFSALIAGGIKEELQRAFILRRFSRYLGGAGLGLVLWSLAFGMGHYVQGPQAIAATAIFGFILGAIYLLRRSLIAPIFAHSAFNTLELLLYWFTAGQFK